MARLSALFAALAALAVAPVQAASYSTASLSNFTITLFDLNPADGITSGITFADPYFGDSASVSTFDDGNSRFSSASGTGPFELSVATARTSARAAVNGTGPTNVTSLTASGFALGTLAPGDSFFYSASASAPSFYDFTVTANTLVSFSAFVDVEALITTAGGENAGAFATLFASGLGPSGHGFQSSREDVVAFVSCCRLGSAGADVLTVSFANLTGSNLTGQFGREVSVSGVSNAVPEPETYAMMVAGLGLLAFMARRRGRLPRV